LRREYEGEYEVPDECPFVGISLFSRSNSAANYQTLVPNLNNPNIKHRRKRPLNVSIGRWVREKRAVAAMVHGVQRMKRYRLRSHRFVQMMSDLVFLKGFLKNWREVGSPVPSSRHLARRICQFIDFQRAGTIVEIGAGTGVITHEILNSLQPDGRLIVFEINDEFCDRLRSIADPRLTVHNISAFQMHSVLIDKADYVVSGIPIATLAKAEFSRLCSAVNEVLQTNGVFIQLQLSLVSYGKLKNFFRDVSVAFTLRNTPPAFLYCCRRPVVERICA